MNRKRKYLVLFLTVILLFAFFLVSFGAEDHNSTAVLFELSPDARIRGLGGTFIGLADDVSSTIYNPAGLGFNRGFGVVTAYNDQYRKIGYNSVLVGLGPLGLAGMRLASDPMEATNQYGVSTGETLSYSSTGLAGALGLSNRTFGLSLGGHGISLGAGFRAYSSDLYLTDGEGYSFSLAGLYRRSFGSGSYLQLGFVVPGSDIVDPSYFDFPLGRVNFRDPSGTVVHEEEFSGPFGAGVALGVTEAQGVVTRLALDWRKESGLRGGLEQKFWFLAGRVGFRASGSITVGAGLNLSDLGFVEKIRIDGAYDWQRELGGAWILSFGIGL